MRKHLDVVLATAGLTAALVLMGSATPAVPVDAGPTIIDIPAPSTTSSTIPDPVGDIVLDVYAAGHELSSSSLGILHEGCYPEQYDGLPDTARPSNYRPESDPMACPVDPDRIPRPGPTLTEFLDRWADHG